MRRPEGAVKVVASPGAGGVLLLRAGKGLRGFLLAFAGGGRLRLSSGGCQPGFARRGGRAWGGHARS